MNPVMDLSRWPIKINRVNIHFAANAVDVLKRKLE